MRLAIYFVFIVFVVFVGYQIYTMEDMRGEFKEDLANVSSEYNALIEDNEKLNRQIQYFSDPHNLEKELRAKFNYRAPGEKLIIVAPPRD